jgi:hypothetical protein
MPELAIDHIILGVHDLDVAARLVRDAYGLDSLAGGKHPGLGTANRIVPLGSSYLELLTVVDEAEARRTHRGQELIEAIMAGDRLLDWAIRVDDIDELSRRTGLVPEPGSRITPDGKQLGWRTLRPRETGLPFFIQWAKGTAHPGESSARHHSRPDGVAWVEVGGDPDRLRTWLGDGEELPVRFVEGPAGLLAAGIATADGEIVLRSVPDLVP